MKLCILTFLTTISRLTLFGAILDTCSVHESDILKVYLVDKDDLMCIARKSEKPYTIVYTLASWCVPCRMHLPDALDLQNNEKVNLFILLVESEQDIKVKNAISFVRTHSNTVDIGLLKDSIYGTKTKKRNKKFVIEMTTEGKEIIDDYGKFIVFNKSGDILKVTSWKDFNNDWKDSKTMIKNTIIPIVK